MKLTARPRRLRQSPSIRSLTQETTLRAEDFCYPLFLCEGRAIRRSHSQVPGLLTLSIDELPKLLDEVQNTSLPMLLLFGVASKKDEQGSEALREDGIVVKGIQEIRKRAPELLVGTDVALDPYTTHGHDGLFKNGKVLNDETVEVLCKMSVLHAQAGAQIVAPSDMMDGRVLAIRESLDKAQYKDAMILSYTAKYASALYGPFRETLDANVVGDKKTYQMNPANRREALRELELDISEACDMVMVKPATWYLDIISDFKQKSLVPVAAYHVSGEAALLELGAKAGLFDRDRAMTEQLTSIKRAGADLIISYHALEISQKLSKS